MQPQGQRGRAGYLTSFKMHFSSFSEKRSPGARSTVDLFKTCKRHGLGVKGVLAEGLHWGK